MVGILIPGHHIWAKTKDPERILQLEQKLEKVSGLARMEVLKELAIFYTDTLSNLATGYATQYLKLAELNNSLADQARAYRIMANIQKIQVAYGLALNYNLKSLECLRRLNDSSTMALEHFRIADNYAFLGRIDSSIIYIDSAYRYFKNKHNPIQIFRANMLLGKAMCMHDSNTKAVEYFLKALEIAVESNNVENIAWAEYWIGYSEMKLGNFDEAEKYLIKSIGNYEIVKKIPSKIGSQQVLGEIYLKTGDFARAYELFFGAYQHLDYVLSERGTKNYLAQYYVNMGEIHFNIGHMEMALHFYDSATLTAREIEIQNKTALANTHIGRVYFNTNNLDTAAYFFSEAHNYYQKTGSKYNIANLLNMLGMVSEKRGDFRQAIHQYRQALAINKEIENAFGLAQNHINLASCFKTTGNLNALKKELDQGIIYAKDVDVDPLLLRYYSYYIYYAEQSGQHEVAHEYFNAYIPLSRQINEKTQVNLSRLLIGLYTNKLAREAKLHNQQLQLTKLEAQRSDSQNKQLVIISTLILLVLILIATLLINRIMTTRKLEKRVNERTRELRKNEQKLIEISETKDRLYSIIAHDLKSPFNSLIGFSNLLHDEYDDFSEEERKQFIEIVRNNAEEIFALLENLLDWTRKSSHKLKFKPIRIDLHQIVKQSAQLQEKNAGMKKITIKNNIPKNTFVLADENMLMTIIRNLTSNAIKFTNENGEISFSISRADGFVACTVADNGIGMSQQTIDSLFDLTKNVKKKGTANEKGTGLGLMLCKDFIERNSGRFQIESRENVGSKFTFSLPEK